MCGRYRIEATWTELVALYHLDVELPFEPRYNVAPTQLLPIVTARGAAREARLARWGLLPAWAKHRREASKMINARAETAASSAAFRGPMRHRRCLVPTTGFYEWKGAGTSRQPIWLRPPGGRFLTLAGLWQPWTDPENGELLDTYTILTTHANALVRPIHDRMPVVLPESAWDRWLDHRVAPAELADLLHPPPDGGLEGVPVDPRLGNVRNDSPELAAPV